MGGSPAAGCGIVGAANRARGREAALPKTKIPFKQWPSRQPDLFLKHTPQRKEESGKGVAAESRHSQPEPTPQTETAPDPALRQLFKKYFNHLHATQTDSWQSDCS